MSVARMAWSFAGWFFDSRHDDLPDRSFTSRVTTANAQAATNHSDAAILTRLRASDEAAFAAIYKAHYAAAVRFACRHLHTKDIAEDVVQDVFASVWERRATLDVDGPILAYLLAGVRRRALHMLRHDRVVTRNEVSDAVDPQPPGMSSMTVSPDTAAAEAMLVAAFHKILRNLPERQRTALVLRCEQGFNNREIARVLEVGESAVSRLLARAFVAFRGLV